MEVELGGRWFSCLPEAKNNLLGGCVCIGGAKQTEVQYAVCIRSSN